MQKSYICGQKYCLTYETFYHYCDFGAFSNRPFRTDGAPRYDLQRTQAGLQHQDPFWLGLTSFAEPGVGQLIAHEPGRGWAFIGGDFLIGLVGSYGIRTVYNSIEKDADGNIIKEDNKIVFLDEKVAKKGAYIFAGAALANLVLRIWSCSDAVKIAKVKNMYNQDLMGRYATATMYPSVDFVQTGSGYKPTAGMTFAVRF